MHASHLIPTTIFSGHSYTVNCCPNKQWQHTTGKWRHSFWSICFLLASLLMSHALATLLSWSQPNQYQLNLYQPQKQTDWNKSYLCHTDLYPSSPDQSNPNHIDSKQHESDQTTIHSKLMPFQLTTAAHTNPFHANKHHSNTHHINQLHPNQNYTSSNPTKVRHTHLNRTNQNHTCPVHAQQNRMTKNPY